MNAPTPAAEDALLAWAGAASNDHQPDAYSSSELRSGIRHMAAEITRLRARVEELEGALKAERLKPCRHTTPFEQRSERPDLHAWQTAQSEWFDPAILEIVSEYAAWRDTKND